MKLFKIIGAEITGYEGFCMADGDIKELESRKIQEKTLKDFVSVIKSYFKGTPGKKELVFIKEDLVIYEHGLSPARLCSFSETERSKFFSLLGK